MLNLKETQLLTHLLYKEWFPTLAYDVHQMGSKGARLFVPPFFDPINPNLDAKLNQGIFLVGSHMAADLASVGKPRGPDQRDVRQLDGTAGCGRPPSDTTSSPS